MSNWPCLALLDATQVQGAAPRVRTVASPAASQHAQPAAQQQARCPFGGLASLVTPRPGHGPAFDLIDHKPYLEKRKQVWLSVKTPNTKGQVLLLY